MKAVKNRSTVLVIYDTNQRYDLDSVRKWFDKSGFDTHEASNFFEAIEWMSDFTLESCPDVILLSVHPGPKASALIRKFDSPANDLDLSIAVLSDVKNVNERRPFNFGSLSRLKGDLDTQEGASGNHKPSTIA